MNYTVRDYKKSDYFQMNDMCHDEWSAAVAGSAHEVFRNKTDITKCKVAVIGDTLIGFAYGYALPSGLLLPEFIYVLPNYRHEGVSCKLLANLEKDSGCQNSIIFYNRELHNHYENQGYQMGENLEVAIKQLQMEDGE